MELGEEIETDEPKAQKDFDEAALPITTGAYLYLSGTPFRAIATGEFIEEQIDNWTYSDEQREKREWTGPEPNPYAALPRMVLMTYQLPDAIREIAMQGEFNEFDLNVFFSADGTGKGARFKYENDVQKWLDLIRGAFQATTVDNLKLGAKKPPMPFSDVRLLNVLSHTLWFLPDVASCHGMSGTSATLLARRWESALPVNVDNATLQRLMANAAAMKALMSIEGFRSLNQDIETIINKSDAVKKARREKNDEDMTPKERKELTEEEKEYKSKRKQIQEKLIKFATRVPVFMYLTDFRERCLRNVITQLEPGLFKKVAGLSVKDFELLVSLGVFNSALMNDAVYKFKRYEDTSLGYTGIDKHEGEDVGLYDTVLSSEDYQSSFVNMPSQA